MLDLLSDLVDGYEYRLTWIFVIAWLMLLSETLRSLGAG